MWTGRWLECRDGSAQRAVARGALRVEAVGHVGGGGRARGWGIGGLAKAARSHRVRRAATFATLPVYPPLAAVLRVEAGHRRVGVLLECRGGHVGGDGCLPTHGMRCEVDVDWEVVGVQGGTRGWWWQN